MYYRDSWNSGCCVRGDGYDESSLKKKKKKKKF